jgi:hypothetical protein
VRQQRWKIRKLFFTKQTKTSRGLATACERSLATEESKYIYTPSQAIPQGPSLLRFVPRKPIETSVQTKEERAA